MSRISISVQCMCFNLSMKHLVSNLSMKYLVSASGFNMHILIYQWNVSCQHQYQHLHFNLSMKCLASNLLIKSNILFQYQCVEMKENEIVGDMSFGYAVRHWVGDALDAVAVGKNMIFTKWSTRKHIFQLLVVGKMKKLRLTVVLRVLIFQYLVVTAYLCRKKSQASLTLSN